MTLANLLKINRLQTFRLDAVGVQRLLDSNIPFIAHLNRTGYYLQDFKGLSICRSLNE